MLIKVQLAKLIINPVVSTSDFFSILWSFLHRWIYSQRFSCFSFYSSDIIVSQKTSKWEWVYTFNGRWLISIISSYTTFAIKDWRVSIHVNGLGVGCLSRCKLWEKKWPRCLTFNLRPLKGSRYTVPIPIKHHLIDSYKLSHLIHTFVDQITRDWWLPW